MHVGYVHMHTSNCWMFDMCVDSDPRWMPRRAHLDGNGFLVAGCFTWLWGLVLVEGTYFGFKISQRNPEICWEGKD